MASSVRWKVKDYFPKYCKCEPVVQLLPVGFPWVPGWPLWERSAWLDEPFAWSSKAALMFWNPFSFDTTLGFQMHKQITFFCSTVGWTERVWDKNSTLNVRNMDCCNTGMHPQIMGMDLYMFLKMNKSKSCILQQFDGSKAQSHYFTTSLPLKFHRFASGGH